MNVPRRRPGPFAFVFAGLVLTAVVVVAAELFSRERPALARLDPPAVPDAGAAVASPDPVAASGAAAAGETDGAAAREARGDAVTAEPASQLRRVAGIVRLPDGRPAAGATVVALRALTDWPEWRTERLDQAYTGVDGTFDFRLATAHGVLLSFEHPTFAGGIEDAPESLERIELRLAPAFDLRGFVLNESGAGMANATVALESVLADQRRVRAVTTSSTGAYEFKNVPAGPVRVPGCHHACRATTPTGPAGPFLNS